MGWHENRLKRNAEKFLSAKGELAAAQLITAKYLVIWFEQIFSEPDWQLVFSDWPDAFFDLGVRTAAYIYGQSDFDKSFVPSKKISSLKKATKYAKKWAYDSLSQDEGLREFVVQTLRMTVVYSDILNNENWKETLQYKNIIDILEKFGPDVPNSPSPSSYHKLLARWIRWDEKIGSDRFQIITQNLK